MMRDGHIKDSLLIWAMLLLLLFFLSIILFSLFSVTWASKGRLICLFSFYTVGLRAFEMEMFPFFISRERMRKKKLFEREISYFKYT